MSPAWSLLLVLGAIGCIKPPAIVIVDRGTALEQQAAGSFDDLERRLNQAAVDPRPEPLTPDQLEALGAAPTARIDGPGLTEADRVDALLVQHCIGEGSDGLLVDTREQCRGVADADQVVHTVERVNRARHQVWAWMYAQRADVDESRRSRRPGVVGAEPQDVSLDKLRRAWHEVHVAGVVCGGWIQGDDGRWGAKTC